MSDKYIQWPEIRAAMPEALEWDEKAMIRLSYQHGQPLAFVRTGNRKSAPMWSRQSLLNWFKKTYRLAPELIEEFESKLQPVAKPPTRRGGLADGS